MKAGFKDDIEACLEEEKDGIYKIIPKKIGYEDTQYGDYGINQL